MQRHQKSTSDEDDEKAPLIEVETSEVEDGTEAAVDATTAKKASLFQLPGSVWFVYLHLFTSVMANTCTGPILVLYMNTKLWITPDDVTFYTVLTFCGTLIPIFLAPIFGFWQGRRPTAEIFAFDAICSGYGFLVMAVASEKWLFFGGYCLTRTMIAQRATRTIYVVRSTNTEQRSQAMSLLPVFGLPGALIGPLITLAMASVPPYYVDNVVFSQYTMCFWIASILGFVRLPLMWFFFSEERFSDRHRKDVTTEDESQRRKDENSRAWKWFAFFSVWSILANGSFGIYLLTMQPIAVNIYNFTQKDMAYLMFTMALITIFPPLLMGILSRVFQIQDRWFFSVGVFGMIISMVVFSLPPGSLGLLIAGTLAVFPFLVLHNPSIYTLFSKIVGENKASGVKLGLLNSAGGVGTAIGALIGGPVALPLYGSPLFMTFMIPILCCVPLLIIMFRYLVPAPPQVQVVDNNLINRSTETEQKIERI